MEKKKTRKCAATGWLFSFFKESQLRFSRHVVFGPITVSLCPRKVMDYRINLRLFECNCPVALARAE